MPPAILVPGVPFFPFSLFPFFGHPFGVGPTLAVVGTFLFYAVWVLVGAGFVLLFCAETKGRSLEEIDGLFNTPLKFGIYGWRFRR